ncbi:hypothetical protein D0865_10944 [Hortaea werneckii]|uniref:Fungal N-terminal domain-containing protein n=1 Tax=Hortaea werneckii TaxID=91943 RepID=A0A3M7BWB2_HORWE|nr:hypothetical protein D0865_10944 [Hortaea werneckii]
MPTGLEEASAILTFVQVGFTLAKTFTTLISEYREAPDELATLANAIVDTLAHIETIKKLLEENEKTHGWNANGIDPATSCLEEAERLVKRIVTLLRKSGADIPPNDRIGPEDISLSVMRRVACPRFTGRIGKINESLAATRQKMLLILTLYKAFTVASQEQQRLARDRVIVLVRGRQVQRARRKYLSQHSNMPSNVQRSIRDGQEDNSVDPASSLETSREDGNESAPEITAIASPELSVRLDVSDEAGNALCSENARHHTPDTHAPCGTAESTSKETQEASDLPGESTKAVNSPTVSPADRPADDEYTPTAVESQSDPSVDQKQNCPPKSKEASSTTKEVGNDADFENEDPDTLHQHNLSSSREDLPQADIDVGKDIDGAPRAESVATCRSHTTVEVTKVRFMKTFFGRLIPRKKVAASRCHITPGSIASNADAELVERSKLWHIGKWTLTRRTGFQSKSSTKIGAPYRRINGLKSIAFSPAPTKFVSLLVTVSVEGCTIVPAHLSRDEPDGRLWHAAARRLGPWASLSSQIYASLPSPAHRMIDRLLGDLGKSVHEILYAEVMGVNKSKAERMIRRRPLNLGASPMETRILLVLHDRQDPKLDPEFDEYQREIQPRPDRAQGMEDQVDSDSALRVLRVNDGANHTDPVQEMMRAEETKKMKREREIEEEEEMKMQKEREEKEKKKKIDEEEEEKEQEKKRREDEIDNDEEEEIFGNVLGLGDDELVQRLLGIYTNSRPS